MNRKISLLALALLSPLLFSTGPALAAPAEIASTIKADKPYGEGHVSLLLIKAYNARFWTDAAGWSMDAPCAMEITYGMGFDTDDLVERTIKEMKNVDPELNDTEVAKLTPQLIKAYPAVKSGDRLTALYVPGKPVAFFYNGAPTSSIDNAYAKDFFGLWLLPNTSRPGLRKELLRLK
jgi:hypothetical protein